MSDRQTGVKLGDLSCKRAVWVRKVSVYEKCLRCLSQRGVCPKELSVLKKCLSYRGGCLIELSVLQSLS